MKRIIKNILIFLSYFIYSILIKGLLFLVNINYYSMSTNNKILITFLIELSYIILLIILYRKELIKDLKDFRENYKKYISNYIIIYLLGIILMSVTNIILSKITNQDLSSNEIIVRDYIQKFPLYMIFSSVIYAPFVEEIIFRKSIKNIIKNKYIFIILSGLIFGLLHISKLNINEILYSIPYIIMGIDFAYIYYKTDNIFTTMTFHLCHNLVLLIFQLI